MKRLLTVTALAFGILYPAAAAARPVVWAGTTGTPAGMEISGIPLQSVILDVAAGKVRIKSLQMVMTCTDTQDGLVSPVAFFTGVSPRATLRSNRYTVEYAAVAGGRSGQVRVTGQLRSNGRGTARVTMTATSTDSSTGATIENCTGAVGFQVRRGPTT
jgi:hypothetical protein